MAKYYDITVAVGSPPGPYTIYYIVNGEQHIATIAETYLPATNLTYDDLLGGITVFVPDNVSNIILVYEVDGIEIICSEIEISTDCVVYFRNGEDILYRYSPLDNTTTQLYDLSTLGVDIYSFAMSERRLWLLSSNSGILNEYDITLYPFTISHSRTYGYDSDLEYITTITYRKPSTSNDGDNLYGMGQANDGSTYNALFRIRTNVVAALNGLDVDQVIKLNPSGMFIDDIYYNPEQDTFLTIADDYTNWLTTGIVNYINQYDINGNVTGNVNLSNQGIDPVNSAILYTFNNDLYFVKTLGEAYLVNKTTGALTYSHTIPNVSGFIQGSEQLQTCADYRLDATETEDLTVCTNCLFEFETVGVRSIYLNVGNLISSNNCGTIGDYWVDWHNGAVDGEIVFTSYNDGNLDPDLVGVDNSGSHPIENGIVVGGTLYPIIKYVVLDGVKYSSDTLSGALVSSDLGGEICLGTIEVDRLACDVTSVAYAGDYDYVLSRNIGVGERSRTLGFDIDNTTNYLAWEFFADIVPDQLNVFYCRDDGVDTTDVLLDSVLIGKGINSNFEPTNYPENPITHSSTLRYITKFTDITYQTGDYIKLQIEGNPGTDEDRTIWTIWLKCFETLDLEDFTGMSDITSGSTPTISYNNTLCQYELEYETEKIRSQLTNSDWKYFTRFGGVDGNIFNYGVGGSGYLENNTGYGRIPNWPGNLCNKKFDGRVIVDKTNTYLKITCKSNVDYQNYLDRIVLIQNSSLFTDYQAAAVTDPQYYGHYMFRFFIAIGTCDARTYDSGNFLIHYSSVITYGVETNGDQTITFTLPTITNEIVNDPEEPCNTLYEDISNWVVNPMNADINGVIFNGETEFYGNEYIGYWNYFEETNIDTETYPSYYDFKFAILFNNIINPADYGWCYSAALNRWYLYQFDDHIKIISPGVYLFERKVSLRTCDLTDPSYEPFSVTII